MTASIELDAAVTAADAPTVDSACRALLNVLTILPERPTRLYLRTGDVTVELDWRAAPAAAGPAPAITAGPAAAAPAQPVLAPPVVSPALPEDSTTAAHYVCAPTIGTFYHAAELGGTPFVVEGTLVNVGQQIGIVEAMKLMMPVESDRQGRVVEVLVPNGHPVEYGQRLIALGPVDSE